MLVFYSQQQIKMLARGHEASGDDNENPTKKARVSAPTSHSVTGSMVHSVTGPPATGGVVPPPTASFGNSLSNGPADISEFQMVQQLQNIKKSNSPLGQQQPPPPASSAAGSSAQAMLHSPLDDVKKEELDINSDSLLDADCDLNELNEFTNFDCFEFDSLCRDLDSDVIFTPQELEMFVIDNNPPSDGSDSGVVNTTPTTNSPQVQPQMSTSSMSPAFQNNFNPSTPPVSHSVTPPTSFAAATASNSAGSPSPYQTNPSGATIPNVRVGSMSSGIPGLPTQGGENPAATTLKNMAQVHQKQHLGPGVPARSQGYPDYGVFSSIGSPTMLNGQKGPKTQQAPTFTNYGQNINQNMYNNPTSNLNINNQNNASPLSDIEMKKRQMLLQHQQSHLPHQNGPMQQQSPQSACCKQVTSSASASSNTSCLNTSAAVTTASSCLPIASNANNHQLQHLQQQSSSHNQQHLTSQQSNGPQSNGQQQSPVHTPAALQQQSSCVGPTNTNNTGVCSSLPNSMAGLTSTQSSSVDHQQQMHQQNQLQLSQQQHQLNQQHQLSQAVHQQQQHHQHHQHMQQQLMPGGPGMMGGMGGGYSRMSPMGGYPGQPGGGAMSQYGGLPGSMRGPGGVRPSYHRPTSISPGAQVSHLTCTPVDLC